MIFKQKLSQLLLLLIGIYLPFAFSANDKASKRTITVTTLKRKNNLNKRNNDVSTLNESTASSTTTTTTTTTDVMETFTFITATTTDYEEKTVDTYCYYDFETETTWEDDIEFETFDFDFDFDFETIMDYETETETEIVEEESTVTPDLSQCDSIKERFYNERKNVNLSLVDLINIVKLYISFDEDYDKLNTKLQSIINMYGDMKDNCYEGITDEELNNQCTQINKEVKRMGLKDILEIKYQGLDFVYKYNDINKKYLEFLRELLEEWKNKKCDIYYTFFTEIIRNEITKCNKRLEKIIKLVKKLGEIEKIINKIKTIEEHCDAKTICHHKEKCIIRT